MNGSKIIEKRQDRMLAFFDAVMAIAMTVLALEITVPPLSSIGVVRRYTFFVNLTCYLISFMAMSTVWYIHNNFFSNHDLTGNNSEIVLHLVLLFVITLFQPLTRAIGEHPADLAVRMFYLIDFFVMYGLVALIFVLIRRREDQFNAKKEERKSQIKEERDVWSPDDNHEVSEKTKELRHILWIVHAIENPEEVREMLAEAVPEEYQKEWEELRKKRETSYRMSLYSVFAMAAAVFVAVVTLIFSIWWSYAALAGGLIAIFLIRHHGKNQDDE